VDVQNLNIFATQHLTVTNIGFIILFHKSKLIILSE